MIIADTDFLSAFLKIDKLELVFTALETKEIVITQAVLDEIKQAPVQEKLMQVIHSKDQKVIIREVNEIFSQNFGKGELESITLAKETNALLLMNDQKAAKFAESEGITTMDIPIFLLHCKTNKLISSKESKEIIELLKEKDYYEFNEEIKKILLN
ncbi:MAG: hypothetical protein A2729_02510 [Candidatus Buchananbacteria bacterium RIFCSPHIGHO2_01_FULL_39_14]|uniref:PIN domain-containing protein n=1 Tax=Candidatus Buchananbacteria bacterium RIFCSPHIGHO2_01_FULL_39_14 TaxID=1797532 RepID=A0A1G1XVY7_9BACT|nr:MAG: hypothetical protein A2729_02510 [Candidatus Buchananbacteria bacterium RIFCSPHIGHO2_01_FULL_39_14]